MKKKLIFVTRQPGTANAFIPLIKALQQGSEFEITILAYAISFEALANAALAFHKIENFNDALRYLNPDIDYLVTGTSEKVTDDELFWRWANENHVPSLAFVDQWSNLTQRFECENLPASIAVMDEAAKKALESYLSGRSQVLITGSPAFNTLKDTVKAFPRMSSQTRILFVLEPDISGQTEDEIRARQGFTEYDCLRASVKATCDYARQHGIPIVFTLKPHPRDDQERIQGLITKLHADVSELPVEIWARSRVEALVESDVVMGMRSMLLLEAAIVHKPVISIQLNRKTPCLLTDDRQQIKLAVTEEKIGQYLHAGLTTPSAQEDGADIQPFNATERFLKILRGNVHSSTF